MIFAHGNLTIFSDGIKMLAGQNCAAAILRNLEAKIIARQDDSFIPLLATDTLQEKCPNVVIKEDNLFDEISALHEFLQGSSLDEWRKSETPLTQRWSAVLNHFKENYIPHTNLARLVSVVMCLPGSNAPVERVFSIMNDRWTDSRNMCTVYFYPPL